MKKCTIVISTSNQRIYSIDLKPNNKNICYIIVHQVYSDDFLGSDLPGFLSRDDVTYICLDYPGLSKSRNLGLKAVQTEYAYIMDDDVDFDLEKINQLVDWMSINQVDVATCQFEYENRYSPGKYKSQPFQHDFLSAAKVASIEICVNIKKVRDETIQFDERFGLGTDLPSGEEYIFITDCLKARCSVWFYPITIGVHPKITSGTDFYTSFDKTLAKREMFKRIFGKKALFFIVAFWVKKLPIAIKAGYFLPFSKALLLGTNN